ncbi:hypothetical protein AB0O31_00635 [Kitasatospora cineracea]|uniref:hypothetical protein n=1 Tax=Kitasatospora cineracea TaxID=88074 RepID=UPI003439A5B1
MGNGWQDDPVHRAVIRAFAEGDPSEQAGGPLDVRAVLAALPRERKDAFGYDDLPWGRFPEGADTRDDVARLRSTDPEQVHRGVRGLEGQLANSSWSVAAMAVPFLLRAAADPCNRHRGYALEVAAWTVRRPLAPWPETRSTLLRFDDPGLRYEPSGYFGTWGIEAARDALAADADLLTALLGDPVPGIRAVAAYTLVAASGPADRIRAALHAQLRAEDDPVVRAGLLLALAQWADEHPDPGCGTWLRARWSDPAEPSAVRVAAVLGWLCLTDAPVPEALLATLDACATGETARLMAPLPWLREIDRGGDAGLRRFLDGLLSSVHPEPEGDDPWGAPPSRK